MVRALSAALQNDLTCANEEHMGPLIYSVYRGKHGQESPEKWLKLKQQSWRTLSALQSMTKSCATKFHERATTLLLCLPGSLIMTIKKLHVHFARNYTLHPDKNNYGTRKVLEIKITWSLR
ncbi:hypothetical protein GOP47_0007309 [Adiantum capillus-veneris]|uniref:Uncharacterized protein n=1 Tax=Adiantum capillus-veneris TaxID=13818 RepID=A0A9D4ZLS8_ADICA|nr:hypothetical protein GOP47_0007309 [Adiantum capillus-veneris]